MTHSQEKIYADGPRNNYHLLKETSPSRIYYNDGLDSIVNQNLSASRKKLTTTKNKKIKVLNKIDSSKKVSIQNLIDDQKKSTTKNQTQSSQNIFHIQKSNPQPRRRHNQFEVDPSIKLLDSISQVASFEHGGVILETKSISPSKHSNDSTPNPHNSRNVQLRKNESSLSYMQR